MTPLTADQKKYLVPAAIGTALFVLCDEVLWLGAKGVKGNRYSGAAGKSACKKSLLGGAAGAVAGDFFYDKAEPATKADIEKYALPPGPAAATFIAVNRFVMPKVKPGKDARPYALGAAAVGAYFTNKELSPSSPIVGLLPNFEPTFEPPFPPAFGPEFNG